MKTNILVPSEIRRLGLETLTRGLGPIGMARFLQQFEWERGNYTKEREQILKDVDVKMLVKEIKDKRK